METEPTPEQRTAYRDWLLADEAAMNASDAVLRLIQTGHALADLDQLERLSARANELRSAADHALRNAVAALHGPTGDTDSAPGRWSIGEGTKSRMVAMIRMVVDIEEHQIGRKRVEPAPTDWQL
jgi:hypothetical protein